MQLVLKPVPHAEAAKWIADKPLLARSAFDNLLPDLKARAFTITGVESANVMQTVRDRIAELPAGADWDEVKKDIAAQISPWLDSPEDRASDGTVRSPSERRAELLLRTHGFQAYTVAAETVAERQRAAFPYAQYLSSQDDQVRDSHAALDGIVLPADSPFWDRHTPPWEWGCRCQKVFLTREDVADMEQADASKIPEARRVISGDRLRRLETSNQLVVAGPGGMPQFITVAPSRTFTFDKTTLRMKADELRPRYDSATWATFETWAKRQELDGGRTVWSWMQGAPASRPQVAPPPLSPTAPAPVPAPAPEPAAPASAPVLQPATAAPASSRPAPPPRRAPVSNALKVRTTAPHKKDIEAAVAAVDRVHDDGELPAIPINADAQGSRGIYRWTRDGKPDSIGVANLPGHWNSLTSAHEIGHFIDHHVFGSGFKFGTEVNPAMTKFLDAATATSAVREIRATLSGRSLNYYLDPRELWARAYAQFIATRSGDPAMAEQLARARSGKLQPSFVQWSDEDFAPVAAAIEDVLRSKGWIQ